MSDTETGRLNLKEYDALIKRKEADDNRHRLDAGFVWSAICNANRAEGVDPFQPTDIVPGMCRQVAEMDGMEQKRFFDHQFFFKGHMKRVEKKGDGTLNRYLEAGTKHV